jgi:hypothetical protein
MDARLDASFRQSQRNADRTLIGRAVTNRRRGAQGQARLSPPHQSVDRQSTVDGRSEPAPGTYSRQGRDFSSATELAAIQEELKFV